jgi:Tfp pilus assembly protein PilZ
MDGSCIFVHPNKDFAVGPDLFFVIALLYVNY